MMLLPIRHGSPLNRRKYHQSWLVKSAMNLGMKFTKGQHAFFVVTHVDKFHLHNHIIFNSTSLNCIKKFKNFLGSGRASRKVSDRLCLEYGLSVIENTKRGKAHYGKWLCDTKPLSHSEKLRQTINEVLSKKRENFDMVLWEIKQGKYLAF